MRNKAKDAVLTAGKVIAQAIRMGMVWTPRTKAEMRLATCRICPAFRPLTLSCEECGCFMVAKVKLDAAECPRKLW